jgi:putative PEP-CTERM system TPR-repeat lipoprotein
MCGSIIKVCLMTLAMMSLLACSPKSPEEIKLEAQQLVKSGDFRRAILEYKNAISKQPNDAELRISIADAYVSIGQYLAAEKEYGRALDIEPQNRKALNGLVNSLYSQFDFEGVILTLEQEARTKSEIDGLDEMTQLYRALSLLELGERSEATAVIQKNIESGEIKKIGQAYLLASRNNYGRAYDLISDTELDEQSGLFLHGMLAFLNKDYPTAISDFESYLAIRPNTFKVEVYLINSLILSNNVDAAEQRLNAIKPRTNDHPIISLLDAEIALANSNFADAKKYAENAISYRLESQRLNLVYAISSFEEEAYEAAFKAIEKLSPVYRNSPKIMQIEILTRAKLGYDIELGKSSLKSLSVEQQKMLVNELKGTKEGRLISSLGENILEHVTSNDESSKVDVGYWSLEYGSESAAIESLLESIESKENVEEASYLIAFTYFKQGKYEEAQKAALIGLENDESNIPLNSILAQTYYKQDKVDEALKVAATLAKLKPDHSVPISISLANKIKMQKFKEARDEVIDYLEEFGEKPDLEVILFSLNRRLEEYNANLDYFFKRYSDSSTEMLKKFYILSLVDMNQSKKVESELSTFSETEKDNFYYSVSLKLAIDSRQLEKAEVLLEQWIKSEAPPLNAFIKLANIYEMGQKLPKALAVARQANKRFPNNLNVKLFLAHFELATSNTYRGEKLLETISPSLVENSPEYWSLMGRSEFQSKKPEAAVTYFEKAYELEPKVKTLSDILNVLRSQGGDASIVSYLKSRVSEIPSDNLMKRYLADALLVSDHEAAVSIYEELLVSGNTDEVVINNLAWLYMKVGNLNKAFDTISDGLNQHATNANMLSTASDIYLQLTKYDELETIIESALDNGAKVSGDTVLSLAETKIALNKVAEARKILEQFNAKSTSLSIRKLSLLDKIQ